MSFHLHLQDDIPANRQEKRVKGEPGKLQG